MRLVILKELGKSTSFSGIQLSEKASNTLTKSVYYFGIRKRGFVFAALILCYEVTLRQVAIAPKFRQDFCAIRTKREVQVWGHMSGIRGADSGLSHSVIRGLVTDRLMTTP